MQRLILSFLVAVMLLAAPAIAFAADGNPDRRNLYIGTMLLQGAENSRVTISGSSGRASAHVPDNGYGAQLLFTQPLKPSLTLLLGWTFEHVNGEAPFNLTFLPTEPSSTWHRFTLGTRIYF